MSGNSINHLPLTIFIFIFLLPLTQITCNTIKKSQSALKPNQFITVEQNFNPEKEIINSIKVLHAKINNDILSLSVLYKGGCKTHQFKLISRKEYAKTLPMQLPLYLLHKNSGDTCNKIITDTLQFNIADIKFPGTHKLNVLINNFGEKLEYNY